MAGRVCESYELYVDYGGVTGVKRVAFRELAFDHEPSDEQVFAFAAAKCYRSPEEVEAKEAIRRYSRAELRDHPRVGIVVANAQHGRLHVIGNENGLRLYQWTWAHMRWLQPCYFVVVRDNAAA